MFEGLESIGNSKFLNETDDQATDRRQNDDNPLGDKYGSINREQKEANSLLQLIVRLQDVEARLPELRAPDSRDTPLALLPNDALLIDVINTVNELLKRDVSRTRIK